MCRSPILVLLWLLVHRCCYVRQTTATCCYKLELMLGQYNWLLHSCACTLKGNLEEPRGVASVSKHIAPTSTHRNCHCYIATLLIEDVLPFMPCLLSGCSVWIDMAELDASSTFWMDIFDLRKLGCCHSSLVEQGRSAWGMRCSTKIWRNYTTRLLNLTLLPHSSMSSHTFSNLFLSFSFIFLPSFKTKTLYTQAHRITYYQKPIPCR